MKTKLQKVRGVLLGWCLFIGIGAVAGAIGMLSDPSGKKMGMDAMLPYFQKLPFADVLFEDLLFSGFALLIVNGLTNLTAATFLILKKRVGIILGTLFGITLMLWICIQFYFLPPNFMSTTYFFFGLFQALTGYLAWVYDCRVRFRFDPADYRNIGTNPRELVVYFSREGYTRKVAYETADKSGAELYEICTSERTEGVLGFWWCGRFGMHAWAMPIKKDIPDLESYHRVTFCTPIWVFGLSAPMRGFCRAAKGRVRSADYILVHFMKHSFIRPAEEMDKLLGIKREKLTNLCCRMGKIV